MLRQVNEKKTEKNERCSARSVLLNRLRRKIQYRNGNHESGGERDQLLSPGRFGEPADIARAVAFLAGPSAAYITGETLHVNGGMYMP